MLSLNIISRFFHTIYQTVVYAVEFKSYDILLTIELAYKKPKIFL
jgi:hypothetical protein